MPGGPLPACGLPVREGDRGAKGGGPSRSCGTCRVPPVSARLGHGEGCAPPIARALDLSHPPAASFVQRGATHPLVFARGPPARFARRPGPPFRTPPPFAHPPVPHKGGREGGGTHPPPARARTLPSFAPPWLRAAVLRTPRPVHMANGEGGRAATGEGVRVRTHTPLCAPCTHSPFAHKGANGARVCPPPTLCTRPTEHAEKGRGHACNGGEGAQGRRLRGRT